MQSAQDFIDWAREEKQANDWMVERWREPIRWFFVTAKAQTQGSSAAKSGKVEGAKVEQSACDAESPQPDQPANSVCQGGDLDALIVNGPDRSLAIPGGGYGSLNDTNGERIKGRTEDEIEILKVMRRLP